MVNISDRWNRNKTDDLQFAFFNGDWLGKLGEHLGHMERHHSARCVKRRGAWPPLNGA